MNGPVPRTPRALWMYSCILHLPLLFIFSHFLYPCKNWTGGDGACDGTMDEAPHCGDGKYELLSVANNVVAEEMKRVMTTSQSNSNEMLYSPCPLPPLPPLHPDPIPPCTLPPVHPDPSPPCPPYTLTLAHPAPRTPWPCSALAWRCVYVCFFIAAEMKGSSTDTLLAGSLAKALCCILWHFPWFERYLKYNLP